MNNITTQTSSPQDQLSALPANTGGIATGAVLPTDMRIKLVRADTTMWDMFLSIMFSITLTLFGVFLGANITKAASEPVQKITSLEMAATWFLGLFALILFIAWVVLKIGQLKKGFTIPLDKLNQLSIDQSFKQT